MSKSTGEHHFPNNVIPAKLPRLDNDDDDTPPLICINKPVSTAHRRYPTQTNTTSRLPSGDVTLPPHNTGEPVPDFLTLAGRYYIFHQDQCFKNELPSTPIMTVIHKIARRIEIIWYNNHPFTPLSVLRCMQTILESERSMIPIRLEAIRRLVAVHTVVSEKSHRLQCFWDPESVLIMSALNMDQTNTLYLPYDITKTPAATSEPAKSIIEDTITNPEKLLNTYSFVPDFDVLVASDPTRHEATYRYSANVPCTYSEALHKQSRQAEILWYDNHPEVPPSFSHCFLTIGESEPLHDKVLREAHLPIEIYT